MVDTASAGRGLALHPLLQRLVVAVVLTTSSSAGSRMSRCSHPRDGGKGVRLRVGMTMLSAADEPSQSPWDATRSCLAFRVNEVAYSERLTGDGHR